MGTPIGIMVMLRARARCGVTRRLAEACSALAAEKRSNDSVLVRSTRMAGSGASSRGDCAAVGDHFCATTARKGGGGETVPHLGYTGDDAVNAS